MKLLRNTLISAIVILGIFFAGSYADAVEVWQVKDGITYAVDDNGDIWSWYYEVGDVPKDKHIFLIWNNFTKNKHDDIILSKCKPFDSHVMTARMEIK